MVGAAVGTAGGDDGASVVGTTIGVDADGSVDATVPVGVMGLDVAEVGPASTGAAVVGLVPTGDGVVGIDAGGNVVVGFTTVEDADGTGGSVVVETSMMITPPTEGAGVVGASVGPAVGVRVGDAVGAAVASTHAPHVAGQRLRIATLNVPLHKLACPWHSGGSTCPSGHAEETT